MKLVTDWRDWWKWYSSHAIAILAALPAAWAALPPDLKSALPDSALMWVAIVVGIGGLLGRVVDQ